MGGYFTQDQQIRTCGLGSCNPLGFRGNVSATRNVGCFLADGVSLNDFACGVLLEFGNEHVRGLVYEARGSIKAGDINWGAPHLLEAG